MTLAQNIDVKYRGFATSDGVNAKIKDITGGCIIRGYDFELGTVDFRISLTRGISQSSVAIMSDGTRIEETADLENAVTIEPNNHDTLQRFDHIYLVFDNTIGYDDKATFTVIKGTIGEEESLHPSNPNSRTHLDLGYVEVAPNNGGLTTSHLHPTQKGFSSLEVAGFAKFHGETSFSGNVSIEGSDVSLQAMSEHVNDGGNPHNVTVTQIGAVTTSAFSSHTGNESNPHNVTAVQVGAAKETDFSAHATNESNPHNVTASQVGAAPESVFTGHVNDNDIHQTSAQVRSDNSTALVSEVRTSDPENPELGRIWFRSDL